MKQKIILFLGILFTLNSQAQFKKGMRMVGSSIASAIYNSGEADVTESQIGINITHVKSYNFILTPSIGLFFNESTVIGASLNINPVGNTTSYEANNSTFQEDKSNSFNIGVGIFLRNYF